MTTAQRDPNASIARELRAHTDSLRELGPEYTDAVAASLIERIDKLVDAKIDARMRGVSHVDSGNQQTKNLAIILALGIPLTAIAGAIAEGPGLLTIWVALIIMSFLFVGRR